VVFHRHEKIALRHIGGQVQHRVERKQLELVAMRGAPGGTRTAIPALAEVIAALPTT
jgi:hypothetical protein